MTRFKSPDNQPKDVPDPESWPCPVIGPDATQMLGADAVLLAAGS